MPTTKKISKKTTTKTSKTTKKDSMSNIALMGLLHLIGWLLGGRGWLAVIILYVVQKDSFTADDKKVFNTIINFNLSFLLYAIVSGVLVIILIGIPLLFVVGLAYLVLLIISSIKYINNTPYEIPLTIEILK